MRACRSRFCKSSLSRRTVSRRRTARSAIVWRRCCAVGGMELSLRRRSSASSNSRSEEHTSELQSRSDLVCRLLLEKKKKQRMQSVSPLFMTCAILSIFFFFFFNDTATTEIYTLSLHDALPICSANRRSAGERSRAGARPDRQSSGDAAAPLAAWSCPCAGEARRAAIRDRKSTRLNSSHDQISYAVFCLKKKKNNECRACLHSS